MGSGVMVDDAPSSRRTSYSLMTVDPPEPARPATTNVRSSPAAATFSSFTPLGASMTCSLSPVSESPSVSTVVPWGGIPGDVMVSCWIAA
jgi:hypothetical protein